ncbi:MAG: hypothetical protein ACOCWM_03625, partial [Cyclobacteriaceae bacterium]
LTYVKGDATNPIGEGHKFIVHIVNDAGKWGAGFVLALSKKWDEPEKKYRSNKVHRLGRVEYVGVGDKDVTVVNMVAQHNTGIDENGDIPLRYSALVDCLRNVDEMCQIYGKPSSIHMPKIGSGLSGGNWEVIEQIIRECTSVPVTVYEF